MTSITIAVHLGGKHNEPGESAKRVLKVSATKIDPEMAKMAL